MNIHRYCSKGGKDLILEYIELLPVNEKAEAYAIMEAIEKDGLAAFEYLNTRQIEKKLWEIKFRRHNRIFYVIFDDDNVYFLHACKKQKGRAEKFELDKVKKRVRELEKELGVKFL